MRWIFYSLGFTLFIFSCEVAMTDSEKPTAPNNEYSLPVIGNSDAEAFHSTHIFTVLAVDVEHTDWTTAEEGLEIRMMKASFILRETLKGKLDLEIGQRFDFTANQYRSDPFGIGDAPGCWSRIDLRLGDSYMVTAAGSSQKPYELMLDGPCRGIYPFDYIEDIHLAIKAEQLYMTEINTTSHDKPKSEAVLALIGFTHNNGAKIRDMYARYFWQRVKAFFIESEDRPLEQVIDLVTDTKVNIEFRAGIVPEITDALLAIDPDKEMISLTLSAWFGLLLQKESEKLHDRLVYVELYDLIFENEQPRYRADDLVAPTVDRQEIIRALKRFDYDRAVEIIAWLKK
jgi:hypothetical protein